VVAYDVVRRGRVVFGTETAPEAGMAHAVAASSAIPLLFRPYSIDGGLYVDGGIASGTHADVVLGSDRPLELVLILAPMAADVQRKRARFHEKMFDRVGQRSLGDEIRLIKSAWPDCEVMTLSPTPSVQNAMRPNPMDASRAVATFMRTLISMKRILAQPEVWDLLDDHLQPARSSKRAALG
jgi:predicted acylesterase/phospholipase RssA